MLFENIKTILKNYKNNNITKATTLIDKSLNDDTKNIISDFNIVVLTISKTGCDNYVKNFIKDFVSLLGKRPELVEYFNSLEESFEVKNIISTII